MLVVGAGDEIGVPGLADRGSVGVVPGTVGVIVVQLILVVTSAHPVIAGNVGVLRRVFLCTRASVQIKVGVLAVDGRIVAVIAMTGSLRRIPAGAGIRAVGHRGFSPIRSHALGPIEPRDGSIGADRLLG